jgi:chemotaxis protein MotA
MSEQNTPTPGEGGEAASKEKGDLGLLLGLVVAIGSVFWGMILEGSSPGSYMVFSAFVIVFGGTMGAAMGSFGLAAILKIPASVKEALFYKSIDRTVAIRTLVGFAEKARREGLLVLEDQLNTTNDPFLKKGVQLVVDGTDPDLVREILETEVEAHVKEENHMANMWAGMGGYSPTLGIIGTVMGLVMVLGNLSDPTSLGPHIAVAFVATWYGVSFANLVFLPIGLKVKWCIADYSGSKELMIEGILAIQAGDNPRIVEEKLLAYLNDKQRKAYRGDDAEDESLDLAA